MADEKAFTSKGRILHICGTPCFVCENERMRAAVEKIAIARSLDEAQQLAREACKGSSGETKTNDVRDAGRYRYLRERSLFDQYAVRGRLPDLVPDQCVLRGAELDRELDERIGLAPTEETAPNEPPMATISAVCHEISGTCAHVLGSPGGPCTIENCKAIRAYLGSPSMPPPDSSANPVVCNNHDRTGASYGEKAAHSVEDDFQHWLTYTGGKGTRQQAFYAGRNAPPPEESSVLEPSVAEREAMGVLEPPVRNSDLGLK